MKSHARVAIIGGGVVGCSLLYHLTKLGWTDAVLLEKAELTSGSTWHAAGNVPHYSTSYALSQLYLESSREYEALEAETGHPVGFHKTGSIRVATTRALMDEHARGAGKARYLGLPYELVGPSELEALHPYLALDGVLGGVYTPEDGHIDPSSLTNAYANAARAAGAEIRRRTRVTAVSRTGGGEWRVETEAGPVTAEHVVNAAGLWVREVAALVGHQAPAIALERQYLVTEDVPGIEALPAELPVLRDIEAPLYIRQERRGLVLGLFDDKPVFWAEDGMPPDFEQELLAPDLERLSASFEAALRRMPILGELGIKRTINGPLNRSADGNPLIGPVPGLPNFWMHSGFFAGIALSGSCGALLARWMVAGEPDRDVSAIDARRFGDWTGPGYAAATATAAYVHEFSPIHPHEEPPRETPARTSALYDRLAARGAAFGVRNGWEAPNWFAPEGEEPIDRPSFRRANWFAALGAECRAVAAGAGLLDFSSVSKYEVSGPDAAAFLDRLSANRIPARPGGMAAAPMLTVGGRLAAFLLMAHRAPGRYYLTGPAASELQALDWLETHCPPGGGVTIANQTAETGALLLAGASARAALERASGADLSDAAFPAFTARALAVGGIEMLALRVSAAGGAGWELHCPMATLDAVYQALHAASPGIVDFGWRAFDSFRLEAGRPRWGSEFGLSSDLQAAGLGRYLAPGKGDFIGRDAFVARQGEAPAGRIARLVIDADADPGGIDAAGAELVSKDGAVAGIVTSGGYGHRMGKGIAFASLRADLAEPGTAVEIEILGERHPARVAEPPFQR